AIALMLRSIIGDWELKLAQRDNNRKVRPFEWGTEYLDRGMAGIVDDAGGRAECSAPSAASALQAAGPGDSEARRAVFDFNDWAIAESDRLFKARPVSDYSFDGHWVSFSSPLRSPYPENNTVHARYFPVVTRTGSDRANGCESAEVR